jgi:hypothetical protein
VGGGAVEEATVSAHVGAVRVKPSGGRRGRCCTGERVLGRGPRPAIKGGGVISSECAVPRGIVFAPGVSQRAPEVGKPSSTA